MWKWFHAFYCALPAIRIILFIVDALGWALVMSENRALKSFLLLMKNTQTLLIINQEQIVCPKVSNTKLLHHPRTSNNRIRQKSFTGNNQWVTLYNLNSPTDSVADHFSIFGLSDILLVMHLALWLESIPHFLPIYSISAILRHF